MSPHPTIAAAEPQCEDDSPRRISRVSVSRKWVLPPRPKPGRKPKVREPKQKEVLLKPQNSPINTEISFNSPSHQPAPNVSKSTENAADDCSLCTKTECVCSEIGIKPAKPVQPSLEDVLNSVPHRLAAVPLKHTTNDRVSKPKLKRATRIAEPAPAPAPPANYNTADFSTGCGFCTDDSSCVCEQAFKPSVLTPRNSISGSPHECTNSEERVMSVPYGDDVVECQYCQDSLSMLFCLSLNAAATLRPESVAIPHHLALKTLQKHGKFATCDLGRLVSRLEVDSAKMVGVQSINQVLHDLDSGALS